MFDILRLAVAIINYRYLAETDQSRVTDMTSHLIKRSYDRALNMKLFERNNEDEHRYQSFIEEFFNRILDYRQERDWKTVPKDQCQEFLKFPKIVNTQTATYANHIRNGLNQNMICNMNYV